MPKKQADILTIAEYDLARSAYVLTITNRRAPADLVEFKMTALLTVSGKAVSSHAYACIDRLVAFRWLKEVRVGRSRWLSCTPATISHFDEIMKKPRKSRTLHVVSANQLEPGE